MISFTPIKHQFRKKKKRGPANRGSTNIHPNKRIVKRSTGGFAPNKSGLSLIGETNSLQSFVYVEPVSCCLIHCLSNTNLHALQYLHWIMLHPSVKSTNKHKPVKIFNKRTKLYH